MGMLHKPLHCRKISGLEDGVGGAASVLTQPEYGIQVVLNQYKPLVLNAAIHVVVIAMSAGKSSLSVVHQDIDGDETKPLLCIHNTVDLFDVDAVWRIFRQGVG